MEDHQEQWPAWWHWELDFTPHLLKRMIDRCFTEVDLRAMMQCAKELRQNHEAGRWVLVTTHGSRT